MVPSKRRKSPGSKHGTAQPPTKKTRAENRGRAMTDVELTQRPPPPEDAESPDPGPSGILRHTDGSPQGIGSGPVTSYQTSTTPPGTSPGPTNIEEIGDIRTPTPHHSTPLPGRSDTSVSRQPAADPATRLAEAIENTLLAVRESSVGEGNSRLVHRLTSAKALPTFSGDPIEWLHFKEAYELTSELGGFSERENIARLFRALKGEARDAVSVLLATTRDAKDVMRTLELHYGNKNIVAEKLSTEIKELPRLDSGKINIVQFSTKLKNAVAAFKSLELVGCLHSFELLKSVVGKLPSALTYAFNKYAADTTSEKTGLEKMADFIHNEVEVAAAAGTLNLASTSRTQPRVSTRKPRCPEAGTSYMTGHETRASRDDGDSAGCAVCRRSNHTSEACTRFLREPVNVRWRLVRKFRLCINCLGNDHMRDNCRKGGCATCRARHHTLLHDKRSVAGPGRGSQVAARVGRTAPERAVGASSANNDSNES